MRILLRWDGDSKMTNTVRTRQKAIMSLARNGSSELRDIDLDFDGKSFLRIIVNNQIFLTMPP